MRDTGFDIWAELIVQVDRLKVNDSTALSKLLISKSKHNHYKVDYNILQTN